MPIIEKPNNLKCIQSLHENNKSLALKYGCKELIVNKNIHASVLSKILSFVKNKDCNYGSFKIITGAL